MKQWIDRGAAALCASTAPGCFGLVDEDSPCAGAGIGAMLPSRHVGPDLPRRHEVTKKSCLDFVSSRLRGSVSGCESHCRFPQSPLDPAAARWVEQTLRRMTLGEKI